MKGDIGSKVIIKKKGYEKHKSHGYCVISGIIDYEEKGKAKRRLDIVCPCGAHFLIEPNPSNFIVFQ